MKARVYASEAERSDSAQSQTDVRSNRTTRASYMREYYLRRQTDLREYNTARKRAAREEFLRGKRCASCGGAEDLEVDHIDPATKTTSDFWGWSCTRRAEELVKCQVLCHPCHRKKTRVDMSSRPPGAKLSPAQVLEIRNSSKRTMDLAAEYGVHRDTIRSVRQKKTWRGV